MDHYEVKISDISLTNVGFAVFLRPKDLDEKRIVPIFIGPLETHSITTVIDGTAPPRPMTHDLMLYMLTAVGTLVTKVVIEEIIDNTFYAKITLRRDEEVFVLDARPSDSIAIALRSGAPIYVSHSVLEEAGILMNETEVPGEVISNSSDSLGKSQLQILQETLSNALKTEDYETAAKIRDQIRKLSEMS